MGASFFVTCIVTVGLRRAYEPALVPSLIPPSYTLLNLVDGVWWDEVALNRPPVPPSFRRTGSYQADERRGASVSRAQRRVHRVRLSFWAKRGSQSAFVPVVVRGGKYHLLPYKLTRTVMVPKGNRSADMSPVPRKPRCPHSKLSP